jgi:hypothetical protein
MQQKPGKPKIFRNTTRFIEKKLKNTVTFFAKATAM